MSHDDAFRFTIHAVDSPEGKGMQGDEASHMEAEDTVLERLRHGYSRPIKLPQKIIHLDLKGAPLTVSFPLR